MRFTLKINTDSAVYYWTVMCVLQGDIKSHRTTCPKDTQALSVPHPGFSSLAHISGGILSGVWGLLGVLGMLQSQFGSYGQRVELWVTFL